MRIVTNPGSNLSESAIARYDVALLPQQIVVDGVAHDTRHGVALDAIDGWVKSAKVHPHVVGTTAAEFAHLARQIAATDREIVAVMTSRKIIGSHDAALVGAKVLRESPAFEDLKVRVCDTGVTDVGAGLASALAGEAIREGASLDEVAALVESFRQNVRAVFTVRTLDYLVKGGRATSLRAFFANLLGVRPVLGFVDGEVTVLGKESAKHGAPQVVGDWLIKSLGPAKLVHAAIFHGGAPTDAAELSELLRRRFDLASLSVRTISPSIYLHGGPGCLGAVAIDANALSFKLRARGFEI